MSRIASHSLTSVNSRRQPMYTSIFFFFVCCFFTLTQESPNLSIKHSHLATRRPFLIQTLLSSSHTESRICDKLERVAHVSHNVMMCRLPQASHIAPQRLTDASARPSHIMHPTSTGNYRYPTSATVCKMNDLASLIPGYKQNRDSLH